MLENVVKMWSKYSLCVTLQINMGFVGIEYIFDSRLFHFVKMPEIHIYELFL